MPDRRAASAPDSRPARREAIEAAVLWALALVATVGLSTWIGASRADSLLGVPRWAAFGIFVPWIVFFLLHLRFFLLSGAGRRER